MRLIETSEDGMPIFSAESKMIKEFRAILEKDKSKDKLLATKELAFIHFWCVHDSRYNLYNNVKEKADRIKDDLDLPKNWKPTKLIEEGVNKYKDLITTRSTYLIQKANTALKQVEDFFKDLNINSESNQTTSGAYKIKPKDVTDFYKDLPNLVKAEQEAMKLVRKELEEKDGKIKDNLGLFESKGFNLEKDRPVS